MSVGNIYRKFVSLKTTIVLLCLLAMLLLLNVVLPQASVIGEQAFGQLVTGNPLDYFLLVTLDLGRLPTSPLFLAALCLFFLQLTLVLADRVGPTWRRIRIHPRSTAGLEAWAHRKESLSERLPQGWDLAMATRTLWGFGFRVKRMDERTLWGVKHRTAPLGFLIFHLSFFLMGAGGILLYYTRFVGTAVLAEGQEFSGDYKQVLRHPPAGEAVALSFTVESVDPRSEGGVPTHLSAVFRFQQAGGSVEKRARVNYPAKWGAASILVQQAGLAPVLWLQDGQGFTLDRVAVAATTLGAEPTRAPLAEGRYVAEIQPLPPGEDFPTRAELPTRPVRLRVFHGEGQQTTELDSKEPLFAGALRPGQAAPLGNARLVVEELRFWVGIRVVSERGGGLLITGFLIGVTGLVWRMLLYRREIVLAWDEEVFRLVGRSESYSWRFQKELETIFSVLCQGGLISAAKTLSRARNGN